MRDSPPGGWPGPVAQVGPSQTPRVPKRRWIAAALAGAAVWIAISTALDSLNTGINRLPLLGFVGGTVVAWKIAGAQGFRGVLIAAGAVFAADAVVLGGLILIATLLKL